MKIAVIGAGFAGLATAYFLQQYPGVEVVIFEKKNIGAGASGAASGLIHPYPGQGARRSKSADQALAITRQLLRVAETHTPKLVAHFSGILRQSQTQEQKERLMGHAVDWKDVEQLEESLFLIHSGITVLCGNYLEGLSTALKELGVVFEYEEIKSLKQLDAFDHIVVAAGFGITQFAECKRLPIKFLKGQALRLEGRPPVEKSFISKGYLAHLGSQNYFEVGSTYEREFVDVYPDQKKAVQLLSRQLTQCAHAKVVECRAGVRVCSQTHYLPIIEQITEKAHVFTGLGSRGLLYHGLMGQKLAQEILSKKRGIY